jgi:uncharacterized protein YgfB (UPF0149 family)
MATCTFALSSKEAPELVNVVTFVEVVVLVLVKEVAELEPPVPEPMLNKTA